MMLIIMMQDSVIAASQSDVTFVVESMDVILRLQLDE